MLEAVNCNYNASTLCNVMISEDYRRVVGFGLDNDSRAN